MTAKRWPILDLDADATETDVRRAYARRLREQGPDAEIAAFAALRAEFEAALAATRSGSSAHGVPNKRILPHEPIVDVPNPRLLPGERFIGQFNWGAFCLPPLWMFAHGLRTRAIRFALLSLLLMCVPFGFIVLLWMAIDYGRRGNALAVKHRTFVTEREFVAVQNRWRNLGLSVVIGTTSIVGALVSFASFVSR